MRHLASILGPAALVTLCVALATGAENKARDGVRSSDLPGNGAEDTATRKTRAKLAETVVSFTFTDQPVAEAFDFLRTLGGVNIVLDAKNFANPDLTVTLKLNNVTMGTALALLTEQIGGRTEVLAGVVFVSDAKGIERMTERFYGHASLPPKDPGDLAVYRKLSDTVVSFTFTDQPSREAFDFLSTIGKIPIKTDVPALGDGEATVTLKLNNVRLGTALQFVCDQLDLQCVIHDGGVLVSDQVVFPLALEAQYDPARGTLMLRARNASDKPMVLDREFVYFVHVQAFDAKGDEVAPEDNRTPEGPFRDVLKDRLVTIKPGEMIERTLNVKEGFTVFASRREVIRNGDVTTVRFLGGQEFRRRLPAAAAPAAIVITYDATAEEREGFAQYTGKSVIDTNIFCGRARRGIRLEK